MDLLDAQSEKVARALAAIVRETLEQDEVVDLPDFGRFYVEHQPAQLEPRSDGQLALQPPRNVVRFDPSS